VQDRYAGDLGDFLKFGLLRWLVTGGAESPRLGVVWYRTPDEDHNADGKHIAYLTDGHATSSLRGLEPDLYALLAGVVKTDRSIDGLVRAGVMPGAVFHNETLDLSDLPTNAVGARRERRRAWLKRALDATAGCDVVFVDPDNGLRKVGHSVPAHRTKSVKHAYVDELAAFGARGQAIVAYHHADRSAPVAEQARRRLRDISIAAPPLAAVRASRGTVRLYLVTAQGAQRAYLARRLVELESSHWRHEFTVYWHST
jgi:hypothetical protein